MVPETARLTLRVDGSDFEFPEGRATIGSHTDNTLVLPHGSVAAKHAVVETTGRHGVQVTRVDDAEVYLNGFRAMEPSAFADGGDWLQIGHYLIEIRTWQQDRTPAELAFLDRVRARHSDDDARRLYADWLDEQERRAEAAWVRAQLAITEALPGRYPDPYEVPADARRLLARTPIENCGWARALDCPKRWDLLSPKEYSTVRRCETCKRSVHYAHRLFDAQQHVWAGRLVAYDAERFAHDLRPEQEMAPDTVRQAPIPTMAPPPPSSQKLPPPSSSAALTHRQR